MAIVSNKPPSSSPIVSIQTGHVETGTLSTGSGEDDKYVDVTISAVVVANCSVTIHGAATDNAVSNGAVYSRGTIVSGPPTAILTSTTNLRIATTISTATSILARWEVVEYA